MTKELVLVGNFKNLKGEDIGRLVKSLDNSSPVAGMIGHMVKKI